MDSETGEATPMSGATWAGIEALHQSLGGGEEVDVGRGAKQRPDATRTMRTSRLMTCSATRTTMKKTRRASIAAKLEQAKSRMSCGLR